MLSHKNFTNGDVRNWCFYWSIFSSWRKSDSWGMRARGNCSFLSEYNPPRARKKVKNYIIQWIFGRDSKKISLENFSILLCEILGARAKKNSNLHNFMIFPHSLVLWIHDPPLDRKQKSVPSRKIQRNFQRQTQAKINNTASCY